jgi:hypothetical protein
MSRRNPAPFVIRALRILPARKQLRGKISMSVYMIKVEIYWFHQSSMYDAGWCEYHDPPLLSVCTRLDKIYYFKV